MDYLKINKALFILLNLTWAIVALPLSLYFLSVEDPIFQWENVRLLSLTLILVGLQVIGYYKLKNGNIFYALAAIYVLSFIIDLDGFKLFNTLLLNIDMIYTAQGEFVLEFRLFDGPSSNWNVRLTDFEFNQIGFNAVGLVQIFFLLEQESYKEKSADEKISGNPSDSESVTN